MLEHYLKHGRGLTPIRYGEKRPFLTNWTQRPLYTIEQTREYTNCEWGWVLAPGDLVIDVDPRNGGVESLRHLSREWQAREDKKMIESFPVVRTPGGGVHLYAKLPPDIRVKKNAYPGIDFITHGGQVLIAGSRHPNGGEYHFDATSPFDNPAPTIPRWLADNICNQQSPAGDRPGRPYHATLTPSQIESLLNQLDVTQYADNDSWLQIMQSVHEASNGEARDLFVDWSLGDPAYADQRDNITARWDSHKPGKANNITAGTLINAVVSSGGHLPPPTISEEKAALPDLPSNLPATVGEVITDGRATQRLPVATLDQMIEDAKTGKPLAHYNKLLSEIVKHPEADRNRLMSRLAKKTGFRLIDLRDAMATIKASGETRVLNDFALEIVDITLTDHFDRRDMLVHAADQRFWVYHGTHWQLIPKNIVDQKVENASEKWKQLHPDRAVSVAQLMPSTVRILAAKVAREVNMFDVKREDHTTIINTLNGEVVVQAATGIANVQDHDPASWLTSVLPVNYDPRAECPEFMAYLRGVFKPALDIDGLIRHVGELMGYTIQRRKDIACWILLTGDGANGKTTLLNILSALMGDAALCSSIKDIERDNHGLARLPGKLAIIDEDLDKGYVLPDGFLKKVSENKILTARPLFNEAFDFENTAICWMAANELPRARDVTHGMMRRAQVVHFGRIFKDKEQDRGLANRIIKHELSGVLNFALAGLRRLRERGYFLQPIDAQRITNKWCKSASTMAMWIGNSVIRTPGKNVTFAEAYVHFKLWSMDQGLDKATSKIYFRRTLESSGFNIRNGGGNKLTIYDIQLKDIEDDGDE